MSGHEDVERQKYIAAYEFAAAEAAAWAEVADRRLWSATQICRHELGMSIRTIATELGVSRTTLTRNVLSERTVSRAMSTRAGEIEDEVFIRVGLDALASPQAQFAAGRISKYERDLLIDEQRRGRMQIPDQIREAVEKYPGISNIDLPRMIVMAAPMGAVPDLRHHADMARCKVDGGDRWWPTKNVADLQPGDQVPRYLGQFEREKNYEWVTVLSTTLEHDLSDRWTVEFQAKDGPSKWPDCSWDEQQPVREL